ERETSHSAHCVQGSHLARTVARAAREHAGLPGRQVRDSLSIGPSGKAECVHSYGPRTGSSIPRRSVTTKLLFRVDELKNRRLWITGCPARGQRIRRVAFWPALVDNPSFHNPTEF